mmetsp:Transcript_35424/g.59712  ORF Transcript_35424/g.59712 Transcript_35424/m.59712 type:complete len:247 (-) Transcript_35424:729-1469(-)
MEGRGGAEVLLHRGVSHHLGHVPRFCWGDVPPAQGSCVGRSLHGVQTASLPRCAVDHWLERREHGATTDTWLGPGERPRNRERPAPVGGRREGRARGACQTDRHPLVAAAVDGSRVGHRDQQLLLPLHRVRADGVAAHLLREGAQDGHVAGCLHEPAALSGHVRLLQRRRHHRRPPHRSHGRACGHHAQDAEHHRVCGGCTGADAAALPARRHFRSARHLSGAGLRSHRAGRVCTKPPGCGPGLRG